MYDDFNFEIVEHIATISENTTGNYAVELNKISFNGANPKIDLRKWNKLTGRMLKGVTLTDEETKTLYLELKKYFERSK